MDAWRALLVLLATSCGLDMLGTAGGAAPGGALDGGIPDAPAPRNGDAIADARAEVGSEGGGSAGDGSAASEAAVDAPAAPPGISCGAGSCDPGSQSCCFEASAGVCQSQGAACSGIALTCDDTSDCIGGGADSVCCAQVHNGGQGVAPSIHCMTSKACGQAMPAYAGVVLCDPSAASPCPPTWPQGCQLAQGTGSSLDGSYYVCR